MKAVISALVFTALAQGACAADYQTGLAAAQRGDFAAAHAEWLPLAEAGDARAQYNIGLMYRNGDGVAQNDRQALIWFGKAGTQGLAIAQDRVRWMYANGIGTRRDLALGIRWTALAARQGSADATSNLGQMQSALGDAYMTGSGGHAESSYLAYLWHALAARNGVAYSAEMRDAVANLLSRSEIARAKAEIKTCISTNYVECGATR